MPKGTPKIVTHWSDVFTEGGDGCWEWEVLRPNGYGSVWAFGRKWLAHRLSFRLTHGREAEGLVRHACDNKACYRPDHLLEGTQKQNLQDMIERDRHNRGVRHWNARLTPDQVIAIRQRASSGEDRGTLAQEFDVKRGTVDAIVANKIWKDERNFA